MKKQGLVYSAVVLTVGSVLAKIFGAIYRVALTRILGGVGIGMYQMVFPLYSLCVVIVTAGLPLAVSKVVAKNQNNAGGVVSKCLKVFSLFSFFVCIIMVLSGRLVAKFQQMPSLNMCYLILAPSLIFSSICAVMKGYFQGVNKFEPTAISNICEQLVKMILGLVLSLSLIKYGLEYAIIGAMISIFLSEFVSLLILVIFLKRRKTRTEKTDIQTSILFKEILPIIATNIILPIASFVDSLVVVKMLSLNFSHEMSVFMYGLESGVVSSIITIPTIFSFAIANVIMPNLANEKDEKQRGNKLNFALEIVVAIALPCVVCFVLFPKQIVMAIYSTKINSLGVDGVAIASRIMAVSGIGMLFFSVNQVLNSSLQAENKRFSTVRNLIIAVSVKYIFELIFLPSLQLNILAFAYANTICFIVVTVLNYAELNCSIKINFGWKFSAKLILSNLLAVFCLLFLLSNEISLINTVISFTVAGIVYLTCVFCTKMLFNSQTIKYFKR